MNEVVETKKPAVVVLVETHLTEEINSALFTIEGYTMFNCLSHSRHTGGVTIYVQNFFKVTVKRNTAQDGNWFISLTVKSKHESFIVCGLYHSPNASDAVFLNLLENEWLAESTDDAMENVICGDFNINYNCDSDCQELKRVMEAYGCKQIVKDDTRVSSTSSSKIDLVFVNSNNCEANLLLECRITDHETISVCLTSLEEITEQVKTVKCWRRYSRASIGALLSQSLQDFPVSSNIHVRSRFYDQMLKDGVSSLLGERVVQRNSKTMSNSLLRMKIERDQLCRRHRITRSSEDWHTYVEARNSYSRAVRNEKNRSIQDELERNKNDGRKLWKTIKRLTNPTAKVSRSIVFDGKEFNNSTVIANKFNEYFVDSIAKIHNAIPPPQVTHRQVFHSPSSCLEKFDIICLRQLQNIIKELKSTSGVEDVTTQVFKDASIVTNYVLLDLINESLETGVVPESWKESTVVPIPKVSNARDAEHFRPINMLELQEKVLETVVKDQLMSFINAHGILVPEQSGFRKNHSTETAINLILRNWKNNVEDGKYTVAIFLDFKRAFETIDRMQLLDVLYNMGIRGTAWQWFKSYLSGRRQRTKFENSFSDLRPCNLGVPQGSVLGPLLFILYINDFKSCLCKGKLKLFADDSTVYWAEEDLAVAIRNANSDLEKVSEYLKCKKLCLNVSKTKWMLVGHRRVSLSPVLKIDGEEMERVKSIKYLGVQVDEKMCFSAHIDYVIKKVAIKYGVLCRINKSLTFWSKITFVKATIMPHFDYCATVLLFASDSQIARLQRLQNKIMRIVLRCSRWTPSALMLDMLQWLSIKQRIIYNCLVFIQKMKSGMLPGYLTEEVYYGWNLHGHNTRRAADFRLPRYTKSSTQRSLFYKGLQLFNDLPSEAKQTRNLSLFKRLIVVFVKDRY